MGDERTRNINELARAAIEREMEVREYRSEAVDRGRSPGIGSRGVASAGLAAKILCRTGAIPWGTGCDALENRGRFSGESRRHTSLFYR